MITWHDHLAHISTARAEAMAIASQEYLDYLPADPIAAAQALICGGKSGTPMTTATA